MACAFDDGTVMLHFGRQTKAKGGNGRKYGQV